MLERTGSQCMNCEKTVLDENELLKLYKLDLFKLLDISSCYVKKKVEFCSIINARSGRCSQNCKYCAQSSYYCTDIKSYPLMGISDVIKVALDAKSHRVSRFSIVTSGKDPGESKSFKIELEMIKEINRIKGLSSCASLGMLNETQIEELYRCGLKRYHHNMLNNVLKWH